MTPTTNEPKELTKLEDPLLPYLKRITNAIYYTGKDDREDVITVLKELVTSHQKALLDRVLEMAEDFHEPHMEMADEGDWESIEAVPVSVILDIKESI